MNKGIITFDPEGAKKYPNIAAVEGLLGGVGRLCFPDGTFQFAENETYPELVYSPRLSEDELERFCSENLSKYEAYFDTNFDAIGHGDDLPPIERFWEIGYSGMASELEVEAVEYSEDFKIAVVDCPVCFERHTQKSDSWVINGNGGFSKRLWYGFTCKCQQDITFMLSFDSASTE